MLFRWYINLHIYIEREREKEREREREREHLQVDTLLSYLPSKLIVILALCEEIGTPIGLFSRSKADIS